MIWYRRSTNTWITEFAFSAKVYVHSRREHKSLIAACIDLLPHFIDTLRDVIIWSRN